jgi:hypothetical protein
MTYKAIKRLLIAVGLALLLTVVMMLLAPQSPTATFSPTDVAMICLIPLLFLGLLLTILALRRKRAKPIPPSSAPPAAPPPPTTGPYLENAHTTDGPRRFGLKPDGVTIGRAPENDLVITRDFSGWETVSQRHAWVYQWTDHWIIEDIHSTNGIHVNGKRTGRNLLRDGWQIDIGGVEFVFRANVEETGQ